MKDSKEGLGGKLKTLRKRIREKIAGDGDELSVSAPPSVTPGSKVSGKSLSNPATWDELWAALGKIPTENSERAFSDAIEKVFGENYKLKDDLLKRLNIGHKVYGNETDFEKYKAKMKDLAENIAKLTYIMPDVAKGFQEKLSQATIPEWMRESQVIMKNSVALELMRYLIRINRVREEYNDSMENLQKTGQPVSDIDRMQIFYEIAQKRDLPRDMAGFKLAGNRLEKNTEFLEALGENKDKFLTMMARIKIVQIFSEANESYKELGKAASEAKDPRLEAFKALKKQCDGILDRFNCVTSVMEAVDPTLAKPDQPKDELYKDIKLYKDINNFINGKEKTDADLAKNIYAHLNELVEETKFLMERKIDAKIMFKMFEGQYSVASVLSYFAKAADPENVDSPTIRNLIDVFADVAIQFDPESKKEDSAIKQVTAMSKRLIESLGKRYADVPEVQTAVENALRKIKLETAEIDADALTTYLLALPAIRAEVKEADQNIKKGISSSTAPKRRPPTPPVGQQKAVDPGEPRSANSSPRSETPPSPMPKRPLPPGPQGK